jgi:hypothetical protein
VKKHDGLILFIDDCVRLGDFDTIAVTTQRALGDNEAEFRESLRRIQGADLYLMIGPEVYHPIDLPMLDWTGK